VHNDDISNVLILNKKSITSQDTQIFKAELEKFRGHQTRILQANHKQTSLLKELTKSYDALLQDKRVRSEQSKYEAFNRQRSSVLSKYRKVYQSFNDLVTGLMRAQGFYSEMRETAESLNKNVVTFVENRRVEGAQVLQHIESRAGLVGWERDSIDQLMEKMTVTGSNDPHISANSPIRKSTGSGSSQPGIGRPMQTSPLSGTQPAQYTPQPPPQTTYSTYRPPSANAAAGPPREFTYNPTSYGPVSPPPTHSGYPPQPGQQPPQQQQQQQQQPQRYPNLQQQPSLQTYAPPPNAAGGGMMMSPAMQSPHAMQQQQQQPPLGWQPPPPPPGPPPAQNAGQALDYGGGYPSGPGGYATGGPMPQQQQQQQQRNGQHQQQGSDPWAGLSGWR
jgi:late p6Gag/p9Gag-like protein